VNVVTAGEAAIRGGTLRFDAEVVHLDHIPDHRVAWSVSSTDVATGEGGPIAGIENLTFINANGMLSVYRGDNRSYLTVRAQMTSGPQLSGETTIPLRAPTVDVLGITIFPINPSIHRGESAEIQATVLWGGGANDVDAGLAPIYGARGVNFELVNNAGGLGVAEPIGTLGQHNTSIRLTVSDDQMPGVTAVPEYEYVDGERVYAGEHLFLRMTAIYGGDAVYVPVHVPQPIPGPLVIDPLPQRSCPHGIGGLDPVNHVHRGEQHQFTARITRIPGQGNPFQDIEWDFDETHPQQQRDLLPTTSVAGGLLEINEHCVFSGQVRVRARSSSVHNASVVYNFAYVTLLTPVILHMTIHAPAIIQRQETGTFTTTVQQRGNPDGEIVWGIEELPAELALLSDQTATLEAGWGREVSLFVPRNEFRNNLRLFANLQGETDLVNRRWFSPFVSIGGATNPGAWMLVAAGENHSMALSWDGTLHTWGRALWGRLGSSYLTNRNDGAGGHGTNRTRPTMVSSGDHGHDWLLVSAGLDHSVGIRRDGTLWAWGDNAHGQLGSPSNFHLVAVNRPLVNATTQAAHPFRPQNLPGEPLGLRGVFAPELVQTARGFTWLTVSAGRHHVAGIKADHTLYTFGADGDLRPGINYPINDANAWRFHQGQLGRLLADDNHIVQGYSGEVRAHWAPGRVVVPGHPEQRWRMVASGGFHTAAIKFDNTLWAWGRNTHGQLGNRAGTGTPGWGTAVQTGEDERFEPLPVQVHHTIAGRHWVTVGASHSTTVAIDNAGDLWAWGNNEWGTVGFAPVHGNAATLRINTPTRVPHPQEAQGRSWAQVSVGSASEHILAIDDQGRLFAWGRNHMGQLGRNTADWVSGLGMGVPATAAHVTRTVNQGLYQPREPAYFNTNNIRFAEAITGQWFSLAISTEGHMYGWGDRRMGQVGDTTQADTAGEAGQDATSQAGAHAGQRVTPIEVTR